MGILAKIFTWWDGATVGTLFNSAMTGEQVGTTPRAIAIFAQRSCALPGSRARGPSAAG